MKKLGTTLAMALVATALPLAASADHWRYETENGTLAFTDDVKQIPARYRASATQHTDRGLYEYARASISEKGAARESAATRLPPEAGVGWTVNGDAPAQPRGDARLRLSVGDGASIEVGGASHSPVVVERRHYRTNSRGIVSPHTVVLQDGKPVAIIENRP